MTITSEQTDPDVITYSEDGEKLFVIAKDALGVQICIEGKFFPDRRNFGTLENAVEYLNGREQEAVEFFKTAEPVFKSPDDLYRALGII